ncbi:MAG: multiheme c-type cytochrome [Bdellovibrionota bacterium]
MRFLARTIVSASILLSLAPIGCVSKSNIDSSAPSSQAEALPDLIPGVSIIYSANLDGEIEPCGCRDNPTGGIHRRWNLIEQKASKDKLHIDSGDLFYKSTPVPTFLKSQWNYQAEVLVRAYNEMKVDAMAPGELDFAAGLAQFEELKKKAKFKIVSSNLFRTGTQTSFLEPYVIVTKKGKKIGLFGLYDETLPLPQGLEATDHLEAAKNSVHELRSKVDVLIALTHLGHDKDLQLAKQFPEIDAIFGGHSRNLLFTPARVEKTMILQPSFRGQHIGLYQNAKNTLYQMDARFDSRADDQNPIDLLLAEAKKKIGQLNRETEMLLLSEANVNAAKKIQNFQTFVNCAQCHAVQQKFHAKTPHFQAYETLIKAKQEANLDCLQCHTVGMQKPGGWKHVSKLVVSSSGKTVDAASFSKSAPKMTPDSMRKISKAFINVQCESCHGAAGEHPFSGEYNKKVSTATCLQCHTQERAPGWYKDGKPQQALIEAKLKNMTCPAGD